MGKKILVVVDMQNDFITGALKNDEALKIIPNVEKKLKDALDNGDEIIFTMDTHEKDYLETEEGKNLPVTHCIDKTNGWEICSELRSIYEKGEYQDRIRFISKETFGSKKLGEYIEEIGRDAEISQIELVGICTDICVISNALLSKAYAPNVPVYVDAACCAGVTPTSHDTAIAAMEACHIHINNKGAEPWR